MPTPDSPSGSDSVLLPLCPSQLLNADFLHFLLSYPLLLLILSVYVCLIWHFVIITQMAAKQHYFNVTTKNLLQQTYTLSLLLCKLQRPHNCASVMVSFMTCLLLP